MIIVRTITCSVTQIISDMSDNPEPAKGSTPKVEGGGADTTKPKVKKGWSNPALRMMGIPRISLPSRNWMIFWTCLAAVGGGIAYDKYEQKQIRKKWTEKMRPLAEEVYRNDRIPRKLSIFIAPAPNDYLEESLRYFRKYVKPILNASALDFDVFTENRQGEIRAAVAERIRELRVERIEKAKKAQENETQKKYEASWTKFFKEDVPKFFKKPFSGKPKPEDEVLVDRNSLYSPSDLLGFYYMNEPIEPKRDDELNPLEAGGVICIGRGAYKEYMTGVHEGLLGPLEAPVEVTKIEEIDNKAENISANDDVTNVEVQPVAELQVPAAVDADLSPKEETTTIEASNVEEPATEEPAAAEPAAEAPKTDDEDEEKPVPKPFITPEEYPTAVFAPELASEPIIMNRKNVPVLFEQPVYVFPLPKITGFLNTHRKIYGFFTRRDVADDFGFRTSAVVYNTSRPFVYKDQFMAKEEELEWPKKWVATGKEKKSEWVQDLVVDDRVTARMKVFDPQLLAAKSPDLDHE